MKRIYISSPGDSMERIYLSVSPEEYPEVKASGACWDDASKSWYIGQGMATAMFSRWLGEDPDEAPFGIASEEAFVASAHSGCVSCRKDIEVICIYCKSGMDTEIGYPIAKFTVGITDSRCEMPACAWAFIGSHRGARSVRYSVRFTRAYFSR